MKPINVKLSDLVERQRNLATLSRERSYEESQVEFIGKQVRDAAEQRALYVRQRKKQTQDVEEAFKRVSAGQKKLKARREEVAKLREKKSALETHCKTKRSVLEENVKSLSSLRRRFDLDRSILAEELEGGFFLPNGGPGSGGRPNGVRPNNGTAASTGEPTSEKDRFSTTAAATTNKAAAPTKGETFSERDRLSTYMRRMFSLLRARRQTMVRELSQILPIENHEHGRTIRGLHLGHNVQLQRQDLRDKDAVSAALGLLGHLILLLSKYLNVPLRFRLRYTGASRCFIDGNFGMMLQKAAQNLNGSSPLDPYNRLDDVDPYYRLNPSNNRFDPPDRPGGNRLTSEGDAVRLSDFDAETPQSNLKFLGASSGGPNGDITKNQAAENRSENHIPGNSLTGNNTAGNNHSGNDATVALIDQQANRQANQQLKQHQHTNQQGSNATQQQGVNGPFQQANQQVVSQQSEQQNKSSNGYSIHLALVNAINPNQQYPLYYKNQSVDFLCALELVTGNIANLLHCQGLEKKGSLLECLEYFLYRHLKGLY